MVLPRRGLVVGNYCHDVLLCDEVVVAESLGGAASFISNVLLGLSIDCDYISKVGPDFNYSVPYSPIVSSSKTTLFHAHFSTKREKPEKSDRILKRIHACDPIGPSDLPILGKFEFGMAVGVAGEILPETLEKIVDICDVVFVDIQGLIRQFDEVDGTVRLIQLSDCGFYHLLPKIGFLKASEEEAAYIDVEEVRKWCCIVVTHGKHGCKVYWKDGEVQISPFSAVQADPTGAGDSFLGGFATGLVQGLAVPDAALLGNLFGSLTVGHIGLPKFDTRMLQRLREEIQTRKHQSNGRCEEKKDGIQFMKPVGHEHFIASLTAAKSALHLPLQEFQRELHDSPTRTLIMGINGLCNGKQKLLQNSVNGEPVESVEENQLSICL